MVLKKKLLKVAEQDFDFEGQSSYVLPNSLKTNNLRDKCKINVLLTVKFDSKRTSDKKNYYVFCTKPYSKIARHFEDRHKSERGIKSIMSLKLTPNDTLHFKKKKLQMSMVLVDALHNKSDFNYNMSILQNGSGKLVVARCLSKEMSYKDYSSCQYCLRFYIRRDLHRHMEKCRDKPESKKGKKGESKGQLVSFSR